MFFLGWRNFQCIKRDHNEKKTIYKVECRATLAPDKSKSRIRCYEYEVRVKHPLLIGHTSREPLVEIKYTKLPVIKANK
jgi:hypothetical protein